MLRMTAPFARGPLNRSIEPPTKRRQRQGAVLAGGARGAYHGAGGLHRGGAGAGAARLAVLKCIKAASVAFLFFGSSVTTSPHGRDALSKQPGGLFVAKAGSKLCLRPGRRLSPKVTERVNTL